MAYVDFPEFYFGAPKRATIIDWLRGRAEWFEWRRWRRYQWHLREKAAERRHWQEIERWQQEFNAEFRARHGRDLRRDDFLI